jgi:hypothetical protein
MSLVGLEPTISADEQPPTYALDCAATGNGNRLIRQYKNGGRYYAGVHNLGIPSAGHNPPPFSSKSKEKTNIMEKVFHFAALCLAIKQYYCLYSL